MPIPPRKFRMTKAQRALVAQFREAIVDDVGYTLAMVTAATTIRAKREQGLAQQAAKRSVK